MTSKVLGWTANRIAECKLRFPNDRTCASRESYEKWCGPTEHSGSFTFGLIADPSMISSHIR
eukprot:scaffold35418_cov74-Attheya_sp.AAC.2